jgi:O-antigen ligase
VSNIGFPWRMAATGALFALCLGGLAASDARLGLRGRTLAQPLRWSPFVGNAALAASVACLGLALFITQRAAEAERKIVSATKAALTITASNDWNNPKWRATKTNMLKTLEEGIRINPHYRKITPMVADELARWGDWANATWIYESVLSSRPYIVAIISNAARGYSNTGQTDKALAYLKRAKELQPRAPSVRSLEVILLSRAGQEAKALELAKEAIASRTYDFDLVNAVFVLAWRAQDYALAERAVELRVKEWPDSQGGAYMQLAGMYDRALKDPVRALDAYRKAAMVALPAERNALIGQIPASYRAQIGPAASLPGSGTQTSASKE